MDVILKSTHCKNCEEKKKYEAHQITTVDYLTWCTEPETKCLMNHDGSASARSLLSSLQILKPNLILSQAFENSTLLKICIYLIWRSCIPQLDTI